MAAAMALLMLLLGTLSLATQGAPKHRRIPHPEIHRGLWAASVPSEGGGAQGVSSTNNLSGANRVASSSNGFSGVNRASILPLHSRFLRQGFHFGTPEYNLERLKHSKERVRKIAEKMEATIKALEAEEEGEGGFRFPRAASSAAGSGNGPYTGYPKTIGLYTTTGEYAIGVGVGSPPQELFLVLDTGSTAMWTPCDLTNSTIPQGAAITLRTQSSSTYEAVGCSAKLCGDLQSVNPGNFPGCQSGLSCPFFVGYGDNSTTVGFVAVDSLTLPTLTPNVAIQGGVAFGCATRTSGATIAQMYSQGISGIMGFGPSEDAAFLQLSSAKLIDAQFSICYDSKNPNGSRVIIGKGRSPPSYINSVPVLADPLQFSQSYWWVQVYGFIVGRFHYQRTVAFSDNLLWNMSSGGVILDSGTTFTNMDPTLLIALVQEVSAQSGYFFQQVTDFYCITSSQTVDLSVFPDIFMDFGLDSPPWDVPPSSYMVYIAAGADGSSFWCFGATAIPISFPSVIVGQTWMVDNIITFDFTNLLIQWAPQNCSQLNDMTSPDSTPPPTKNSRNLLMDEVATEATSLKVSCNEDPLSTEHGLPTHTHVSCSVTNAAAGLAKNIRLNCSGFEPSYSWNINEDCSLPDNVVLGSGQKWEFGYHTAGEAADFVVSTFDAPAPAISVLPPTDPFSQLTLVCGSTAPAYMAHGQFVYQYGCTVSNGGSDSVSQVKLKCNNFEPSSTVWNINRDCSLPVHALGPGQDWSFGFQTTTASCSFSIDSYVIPTQRRS